jgi:anti-sigma-K factor RskA
MNLQSFLQSGLLESYVLGQCNPTEKAEVELMLGQHEEVRTELKNIEMALEQFAQTQAVAPPSWMKGRIEDMLEPKSPIPTTTTPQSSTNGSNFWSMILGASALVLGTLFFNANNKAKTIETDLNKAKIQLKDCETQKATTQNLQKQIAHINDPATQKTVVKWLETGVNSAASASVYYNSKTQKAFVSQSGIPPLQGNQTYQLWVIVEGNPNPMPLNLLKNEDILAAVNDFNGRAQAFAISIEPKGGTPNGKPTTVVMLGKLAAES